jgi:hypothetical protein
MATETVSLEGRWTWLQNNSLNDNAEPGKTSKVECLCAHTLKHADSLLWFRGRGQGAVKMSGRTKVDENAMVQS